MQIKCVCVWETLPDLNFCSLSDNASVGPVVTQQMSEGESRVLVFLVYTQRFNRFYFMFELTWSPTVPDLSVDIHICVFQTDPLRCKS